MAATLTIVNQHGQTLAAHRLGNTPLAIRAQDQVQYQLAGEGGMAPANVEAARAGNDLLVHIDGQQALRIEDYFLLDDSGLKNPLLGMNESGQYVAYGIVEAPSVLPVEHVLAEEVAGVGVAAGEGASVSALTAFGIGTLALGGLALAAQSSNENNDQSNQPAPPPADNGNTTPPPSGGGNTTPPPAGGGNTNPPPQQPKPNGNITIEGEAKVGQTLTAKISDADGVSGSPQYQWLADGQPIANATQSTYTLTANEKGKAISVQATYTDDQNTPEKPSSAATAPVIEDTPAPPPPAADTTAPTLAISATPSTLTPGGSTQLTFKASEAVKGFTADDVIVQGGTLSNFRQVDAKTFTATFTAGAAGKASVTVADDAFVDLANNPNELANLELVIGAGPTPPMPQNHAPTDIMLSADRLPENKSGAIVGKLATVDPDAGDSHTYAVSDQRFEVDAQGNLKLKAGETVEFAQEPNIKLNITTTDQGGASYQETFTLNVQDDPNYPAPQPPAANQHSRVVLEGTAQVGKTLTAKLTDGNGFDAASVRYQWFADDKPIAGANGASYQIVAADAGKNLSVQALYTDAAGYREAPVSDLSATVIAPPQGNTFLPKPPNNYIVSVKDGAFLAKGDGKTDDTAAIQKAVDAVAEKGGGVVEVPGGTYLIDGLTSVNMRSNVTLKLADDAVFKAIANDSESYTLIQFIEVENAHLTGGTLIGDRFEHGTMRGEWGHGVGIYSSKNIVVENVVTRDFWGDGFSIGRAWGKVQGENIVLNQITGDNNRRQAVFITDGKNIKILNSLISNINGTSPQAGIDIEPDPNRQIENLEIRGNTFENNIGWGLLVSMVKQPNSSVKNVIIEDNLFKNNERGIALWGLDGGRVAGNTIHHDGDERMPNGIFLSPHTKGVTVEGNTIYGGGVGTNGGSDVNNTIGKNEFKAGVFIIGDPKTGEALTARVIDGDNPKTEHVIPEKNVQYQWYADGEKIDGATAATYTPTAADSGKTLSVRVAFTDASGNPETAESRTGYPVDGQPPNRAPHNILLNGENYPDLLIPEGKPGAVIGKITTLDADPGDTHTYFVRDLRFEIKDGYLKLKDGVKIDHEHEKEIFLAIYAYDRDGGNELREYNLRVADDPNYHGKPNQAPTGILLSNDRIPENTPGATVGKLTPVDADNDGYYTYHLSDRRFYVDEQGYLKLRDGVILEHTGRSIPITTTVTDSGNNRKQTTFFIKVDDNPAWPENRPGQVKVEGNAKVGQTLTASLADPDGVPDNIQYQWYADGNKIEGAQSADYTVQAADLGKQLTAEARYTDQAGHIETAESARSFPVRAAASGKNLKLQAEPELNLDNLERGSDVQNNFVIDGHGIKTVTDFHISHGDLLQLESDAFPVLDKGTLAESAFTVGDKAGNAEHRVIYNASTGELAYDPDGSGAAASTIIARLDPALELEAQHIQII